nr:exodeoxyribonuclease V subunit alpha [Entomospira nematocera]
MEGLPSHFVSSVNVNAAISAPLILDSNYLYLLSYWKLEQVGRSRIDGVLLPRIQQAHCMPLRQEECENFLHHWRGQIEKAEQNSMGHELYMAGERLLRSDLLILSGGPGSGKTYSLTRLLRLLVHVSEDRGFPLRILLTAPTAKAVARMAEGLRGLDIFSSGQIELLTLHKALGAYGSGRYTYGSSFPWRYDIVVVDESSMVDIHLFHHLLGALKKPSKLLIVGDANQLPSISSGAVLQDLVHWTLHPEEVPRGKQNLLQDNVIFLEGSKRSTEAILSLANDFLWSRVESVLQKRKDFLFSHINVKDSPIAFYPSYKMEKDFYIWVVQQYGVRRNEQHQSLGTYDTQAGLTSRQCEQLHSLFDRYSDFTVITPTHDGVYGVKMINKQVQLLVGGSERLYHGLPIVLTKNQSSLNLSNGDRGVIAYFKGICYAVFKDSRGDFILHLPTDLQQYEVAYAITVHKSQGSEYTRVAVVLPKSAQRLLENRLVYTAITRAKKQVMIFGEEEELKQGLQGASYSRTSQLSSYILG